MNNNYKLIIITNNNNYKPNFVNLLALLTWQNVNYYYFFNFKHMLVLNVYSLENLALDHIGHVK